MIINEMNGIHEYELNATILFHKPLFYNVFILFGLIITWRDIITDTYKKELLI